MIRIADIDWTSVRKEMNERPWEAVDDGCAHVRHVWLGTIYALTPSGKYYTAFACSNVSDAEADADEAWWDELYRVAEEHGYSVDCNADDIYLEESDD